MWTRETLFQTLVLFKILRHDHLLNLADNNGTRKSRFEVVACISKNLHSNGVTEISCIIHRQVPSLICVCLSDVANSRAAKSKMLVE